mmetsp:Transcript_6044/g.19243  ORF Transcript_6044/g.19243 Transcript_6044/m.19243 type:complete len:201 (-) Transcript_6044:28-630(-)
MADAGALPQLEGRRAGPGPVGAAASEEGKAGGLGDDGEAGAAEGSAHGDDGDGAHTSTHEAMEEMRKRQLRARMGVRDPTMRVPTPELDEEVKQQRELENQYWEIFGAREKLTRTPMGSQTAAPGEFDLPVGASLDAADVLPARSSGGAPAAATAGGAARGARRRPAGAPPRHGAGSGGGGGARGRLGVSGPNRGRRGRK